MSRTPRISIITPSFNQARFIGKNIESVASQDYPDYEHIIMDGGSRDGTVELLRQHAHLRWTSQKDGGQSDALNKGLALATGEIVGWVNSDDFYQPRIFAEVARHFENPQTQWVIGNLSHLFDATGECVQARSEQVTLPRLLARPDIVRQQCTFFRRELLLRAGGWDAQLFMAMDFDLWVRLARLSTPLMVDAHWACFRIHADQKTSVTNYLRQEAELVRILRREGVAPWPLLTLRLAKRKTLAKQMLKHQLVNWGVLSQKYRSRPVRLRGQ